MAVNLENTAQPLDFDELRLLVANQFDKPFGIAIEPTTNDIYVTNCAPKGSAYFSAVYRSLRTAIYIFNEKGKLLKYFTHQDFSCPYGVIIHQDNIYVTDIEQHFLFQFKVSVDNRFIAKIGGFGSGREQFDEPRQLAISSNGDVYVTDSINNRIQIYDSDLRYQRKISHHAIKNPCDVKLYLDRVYVLYDLNAPSYIDVFTQSGEKIDSIALRGKEVLFSNFFCIDVNGNFIFSDYATDRIKMYTKDGVFLDKFGKDSYNVGSFQRPRGIAVTNNRKLVTANGIYFQGLQIFSP